MSLKGGIRQSIVAHPVNPELGMLRQENGMYKASLDYTGRPWKGEGRGRETGDLPCDLVILDINTILKSKAKRIAWSVKLIVMQV